MNKKISPKLIYLIFIHIVVIYLLFTKSLVDTNDKVNQIPLMELLKSHTSNLDVTYTKDMYNNKNEWRIKVVSKDSKYFDNFKDVDLEKALDQAWGKINAYNAYIENK